MLQDVVATFRALTSAVMGGRLQLLMMEHGTDNLAIQIQSAQSPALEG
jgi:hypothetical protein